MMAKPNTDLKEAHSHCSRHKAQVRSSHVCGCFYCLNTFPPSDIKDWIDGGETALCPSCGIDSVIGLKSGYPITDPEFLRRMYDRWFA